MIYCVVYIDKHGQYVIKCYLTSNTIKETIGMIFPRTHPQILQIIRHFLR